MNFIIKLIPAVILVVVSLGALNGADALPDAGEFSRLINDPGNGKAFSISIGGSDSAKRTATIQRILPDGTRLMRSEKSSSKHGVLGWVLMNEDGYYLIIGDTAVKKNDIDSQVLKLLDFANPAFAYDSTVELVDLEGEEGYLVTRKFRFSDADKQRLYALLPEEYHSHISMDELMEKLPVMVKIYIKKGASFPYKVAYCRSSGEQIGDTYFSNFKVEPDLPEDYFELPDGIKVVEVNTYNEFVAAQNNIIRELIAAQEAAEAPVSVSKWKPVLFWAMGVIFVILVIIVVIRVIRKKR